MADLSALQQQRQQLIQQIQAKGGKAAAPKLTQRLAALEAQIRQARQGGSTPPATTVPPPNPGATAPSGLAKELGQKIDYLRAHPEDPRAKNLPNIVQRYQAAGGERRGTGAGSTATQPMGGGGGNAAPGTSLGKRLAKKVTKIRPNRPGQALNTESQVEDFESQKQIQYQNPDVVNPYGSQTTTIDPVTGKPTVTQTLSADQQKISDQDTKLSTLGRSVAEAQINSGNFNQNFNPELSNRYGKGDLQQDRSRIEQATYGYLTRDMADQNQRDENGLAQRLAVAGIDPNSDRARREWQNLRDSQARERGDARYQAVQLGGQELERNFGIGEQRRANQLSEQLATRGQQLGEINQFSNLGPGLRSPEFQQYQGPDYQLPGAIDTKMGLGQFGLAQKLAQQQMRPRNTGVAGPQQPPPPDSPFYSTPFGG